MPLKTFRQKGREVYELTLFYIDKSFNYRDGWGQTSTDDLEPQGFEYAVDKDDIIIPDTVKGFGIFDDIDKCKSYATLYEYFTDLIRNIKAGTYKTAENPYEDVEHWVPMLRELKDSCFEMMKPAKNAA